MRLGKTRSMGCSEVTTEAKRLAPTPDTLREIFLKSGNLCAYPDCSALMMDASGVFIGQLCHIEAAEEGGQRFNPNMTNDERRAPANLMLMCYPHHKITDNVEEYPVARMRQIKADHEARFSDPQRAILATLRDWTAAEGLRMPRTLKRMNEVLDWGFDASMLSGAAASLAKYLEKFAKAPIDARRFIGQVALRAYRTRDLSTTEHSEQSVRIACQDVEAAFRLERRTIGEFATALEMYKLGTLDEMYLGERAVPALVLYGIDGWNLWADLARFTEDAHVPIETLTERLDFTTLDG